MHGYLTRDGISPETFLAIARAELASYASVEYRHTRVEDALRQGDLFELRLERGERVHSRTVLVATGVVDSLPPLSGLEPLYGKSVHHCPYCDAWEWRDAPVAAYGRGEAGALLALKLRQWSSDIVWCADGDANVHEELQAQLAAAGVSVRPERLRGLDGRDGRLEQILFEGAPALARTALFLLTEQRQGSALAERLGCRLNDKGTVETRRSERTDVPGVFVAGDASKDSQLVIVAAAEGAEAAVAIDALLSRQDRQSPLAAPAPV